MTDLARLRELLAAATPGPWETAERSDTINVQAGQRAVARCQRKAGVWRDAALIVAAVNALPALLDRIEALERVAEAARRRRHGACRICGVIWSERGNHSDKCALAALDAKEPKP